MAEFRQTSKTKIKRLPIRGNYDKETIYQILDEALICHVGIIQDGEPFVMPTIHARMGDELILHGAPASRLLKNTGEGNAACITVTHVDGLVLARSAFHHSMNYRSVVIFGKGRVIDNPQEKQKAFNTIIEHIVPGRTQDARQPDETETKGTKLVAIPINEASAKIRTGPPIDDEEDLKLPIWAGVIPLTLTPQQPKADPYVLDGVELPNYVMNYKRV